MQDTAQTKRKITSLETNYISIYISIYILICIYTYIDIYTVFSSICFQAKAGEYY